MTVNASLSIAVTLGIHNVMVTVTLRSHNHPLSVSSIKSWLQTQCFHAALLRVSVTLTIIHVFMYWHSLNKHSRTPKHSQGQPLPTFFIMGDVSRLRHRHCPVCVFLRSGEHWPEGDQTDGHQQRLQRLRHGGNSSWRRGGKRNCVELEGAAWSNTRPLYMYWVTLWFT